MLEEEKLNDDVRTAQAYMLFGGPTLILFLPAIFPIMGTMVVLFVAFPSLGTIWTYGTIVTIVAIVGISLIGEHNHYREFSLLEKDPSTTRKQYIIALNKLFIGATWFIASLWLLGPMVFITIGAIPINPSVFYAIMYPLTGASIVWTLWNIGRLFIRIQHHSETKAQLRFETA